MAWFVTVVAAGKAAPLEGLWASSSSRAPRGRPRGGGSERSGPHAVPSLTLSAPPAQDWGSREGERCPPARLDTIEKGRYVATLLRMALMAAHGVSGSNAVVSPANLAFARQNLASLEPRVDVTGSVRPALNW